MSLEETTKSLYNPARAGFEEKGEKVDFTYSEDTNHILKVTGNDKEILLPISKNYALVDGEKVDLGGLVIFNGESVYVPNSAFELLD